MTSQTSDRQWMSEAACRGLDAGHQMDRYWYRTYIAATRSRTPTVEHLTAEILGSPVPPEKPERCTHRNQEEGTPC